MARRVIRAKAEDGNPPVFFLSHEVSGGAVAWTIQWTYSCNARSDMEALLRHAVEAYGTAQSSEDGNRKAHSVLNLAERLLSARLKFFRARIAELQPVVEGKEQTSGGIEKLKAREAQAKAEGVDGILMEFGGQAALK